jgi:recombination protein RecT
VTIPNPTALTIRSKYDVVSEMLTKSERGIEKLLTPFGMRADRMVRVTLDLLKREPHLCECDPRSVVLAVLQSAELGLEVGSPLGHAYLIPFKGKAKLIPGYMGLITLAYDDPRIVGVRADHVHDGDVYEETSGTSPSLNHVVNRFSDRGRLLGVYGAVQIRDGWPIFRALPIADVETIRDASLAKLQDWQRKTSPWVLHSGEMQLKTALRRVLKAVPLGSRLRHAVELDAVEYGEKLTDPRGRAAEMRSKVGDVVDAEIIDEETA